MGSAKRNEDGIYVCMFQSIQSLLNGCGVQLKDEKGLAV
jgi:hypothetical protein